MSTPIIIQANILITPGSSFNSVYLLSIMAGIGYMYYLGLKRKYPISTWSAYVFFVATFFIIGLLSKPYSVYEFRSIVFDHHEDISQLKYAPRGILFGLAAMIFGKFVLRIKVPLADKIVYALLIMGIIQRIGCFMNGCCYGTPTTLPWAVSYSCPAFLETHQSGVHPTQLYTILGYIFIIIILPRLSRLFRVNGNAGFAGLILIAINRFLMEYWRESGSSQIFNSWIGELTALQLLILPLIFLIVSVIIFREWRLRGRTMKPTYVIEALRLNAIVLALLLLLVWNVREIFDAADSFLIMVVCLIALVSFSIKLYKRVTLPAFRILILMLGLGGMVSMGQIETYTIQNNEADSTRGRGWFDAGFGLGGGVYDDINVSRNCEGSVTSRDIVSRKHFVANINANYNFKPSQNQLLRISFGGYNFNDRSEYEEGLDFNVVVVYPRVSYDFKYVGMGAGIHLPVTYQNNWFKHEHNFKFTYPSFMLRWGPKKYFFGDVAYYWDFHYWGIPAKFQMGAGSGFGRDDFIFRIGYAAITEEKNLFHISTEGIIKDRFHLKVGFAVGNQIHGFIGLNYHFGKNAWVPFK